MGLIAIAIYLPTLRYGFVGYDDTLLVVQNQPFLSDLGNVPQAFRQGAWSVPGFEGGNVYYRPAYTLSFMADAQVGGARPLTYHLDNVLQHGIASALVAVLLLELGYGAWTALLVGAFFAAHPAFVNVVAWVPGRADSLLAIFTLLSVLSWSRLYRHAGGPGKTGVTTAWLFVLGNVAAFALALFTKESAVVLPAIFALLWWERGLPKPGRRWLFPSAAMWFVTIAVWYALRSTSVSAPQPVGELLSNLGRHLLVPLQYVGKSVLPLDLSVTATIEDTNVIWGLLAVLGIGLGLVFSRRRRNPRVLFGLLWFLILVLPPLTVPRKAALEQRMYVPIVGLLLILLEIDALKALGRRAIGRAALALVIAGFGAITLTREPAYASRLAFWESAVATAPHAAYARASLGAAYVTENRYLEAQAQYEIARQLNPLELKVNHNLGFLAAQRGDYEAAKEFFAREIEINPTFPDAYFNLGQALSALGQHDQALRVWLRTLEVAPRHRAALQAAVQYYASVGRRDEATSLLNRYGG
ncbi:MAG: tetratricopeptide repeat protein [Candidatus Eisenbacteria bacterium]